MKWFGSLRSKDSATAVAQPETTGAVHTSLALNVLFHQFRPEQKYNILDLGPAFGANVEFFSQFSCKIYIEDFYKTLTSFDYLSPEDGFSYEAVFEYLLPYRRNTRFDVVLSWDLFNYLEREEFQHLIHHLGQFCRQGTVLFGLISTMKHIPEKPTHFKIVDAENLLYEINSTVLKPCPRFQQSDLDHIMANFRVCNSFLLRNGFKEYLFHYE